MGNDCHIRLIGIWLGSTDADNHGRKWIPEGKTILDGLNELADEYGLTIITDPAKAADADLTLLCLGEKTYTEWKGDSADINITGSLGLTDNKKAIDQAKSLGNPTVALIVSGRNVIISDYMEQWDGIVMCYLPGSEGDGIANVLTGKKTFKGLCQCLTTQGLRISEQIRFCIQWVMD